MNRITRGGEEEAGGDCPRSHETRGETQVPSLLVYELGIIHFSVSDYVQRTLKKVSIGYVSYEHLEKKSQKRPNTAPLLYRIERYFEKP